MHSFDSVGRFVNDRFWPKAAIQAFRRKMTAPDSKQSKEIPMKFILMLSVLLAAGAYADDYAYVASAEIAIEERDAFFDSLEASGLKAVPRAELIAVMEKMQPGHSFLLERDVIFDGAYRTVEFAIQMTDDRMVEVSILSHGKKFSDQMQYILNSIQKDPTG